MKCKRCFVGVDDDSDGNCAICARWPDIEAARVRQIALRNLSKQGI